MTLTSPSASAPSASLSPVLAQERIVTLDVLRGIALLGVVVANVWMWFSGLAFRFPAYREQLHQLSLDSIVFIAIFILVSGKAISTFSFLFGHGFAIQMLRAQARGRSVARVYARRLAVLLVIGVCHMLLLWYGDILTVYAALGFVLLMFRNRGDRTLLVWAAVFMVGVPMTVSGLPWVLSTAGITLPPPDLPEIARRNAATLSTLQHGGYPEILRENVRQAGVFYLGRKAPMMLFVLGWFLIGLYTGRHRVFQNVDRYEPVLRRIAAWGVPIGIGAGIGIAALQITMTPEAMNARPGLIMLATALFLTSTFPLAAGYVSMATLLLRRRRFAQYLSVFAPVGRMALTNYLTQTVVMLLIFYPFGGGLVGRTGPAAGLLVALAVFGVQTIASRVWLTYFQFGPMEWVWRSLTYGTPQPIRAATTDRVAAAAANIM